MQPVSKKREVQFRGPTSSEEFNEYLGDSYFDIAQLFSIAAEHGIKIPRNLDLLMRENHFLSQKIAELEFQLESIESNIGIGNNALIRTYHSTSDTVAGEPSSLVNTDYRMVTQPIAQEVSKTYLLSDGVSVIPKQLEVTIYESTQEFDDITNISSAYKVFDQEVYNAFNKDDSKYWQRKVYKPNTENTLYVAIHIKLPQNIINHLKVNTIYLRPSPEYSQSLLDIQYKNTSNWLRLPTYPTHIDGDIVPDEISNSSREAFIFPETNMTELIIYLKQPHWFDENGEHLFVYGFRDIEIMFTRFEEADTTLMTRFDIPDDTKSFATIESVSINKTKGGVDLGSLVSYQIFVEGSDMPYAVGDTLPALTKTIFIETTMRTNKGTNVSPAIESIKIEYTAI